MSAVASLPSPAPAPSASPPDAVAARFFALSPDPLCLLDRDGVLRHVNPAFTRVTGRGPAEAVGVPFAAFAHPDDAMPLAMAWDRAADTAVVLRFRCRDGLYRRLSWQLSAPDAGGTVHAIGHDVTEREAAALALATTEASYQHTAANAPGVVYRWVYRADGTAGYTFVSEGARTLFGIDPEAALRDPSVLVSLIHPEESAAFVARAREAAATLGPFRWEGRVVLATGELRFVQVVARAQRLPDDSVVSDGLITDITALRVAAQRLEESQQRYRSLFEHNPDAVFSFDLQGAFLSANPACESVSGYTPSDLIGTSFVPLIVPEDLDATFAHFRRAAEGTATRYEVRLRHRSGREVRLGVTNVPIIVGDRVVGVFGIAEDLTAQRALEERLRQAQKMEAVGQLAGGIAHDFNNLLMIIRSYGAFAAETLPEHSDARADLAEALGAAERAQELTRQLLAFGRKQVLRPQRADVNRHVTNVAGMLRRVIGEDIRLERVLEPAPWPVVVDPGQLEQVLMNLAVNARDAMPGGGTLRLRTENVTLAAQTTPDGVEVPAGAYAALVVEDTGVGIAPETRSHIFEPFFTTKGVGKGTGLGLATVHGIVQQSGGFVLVESAPGRGSRFTVLLPAALPAGEAPAAPGASAEQDATASGRETILLVEDEDGVRTVVRRALERQGYVVREASSGAEAIRLAEAIASTPDGRLDLVLTDLVMPGQSGRVLGEALVQRWPGLPVLYMSGYTDDEIFRRGLSGAGNAFLEKPFTSDQLALAVRRALATAA
jgi:two-component system cell cycle sensor histidine kinase/response regulator CckA